MELLWEFRIRVGGRDNCMVYTTHNFVYCLYQLIGDRYPGWSCTLFFVTEGSTLPLRSPIDAHVRCGFFKGLYLCFAFTPFNEILICYWKCCPLKHIWKSYLCLRHFLDIILNLERSEITRLLRPLDLLFAVCVNRSLNFILERKWQHFRH